MRKHVLAAAGLALALAACDDQVSRSTRHLSPIPPQTLALMGEKGMSRNDPILVRAHKKESELEVWKRGQDMLAHGGPHMRRPVDPSVPTTV